MKKKGVFQKKDLVLTLQERVTNNKTHKSSDTILSKEELDLGQFVNESEEITQTKELNLVVAKSVGKTKLKIVVNSRCLKNVPGQ